ncbi:MAG: ABC transporter permease [Candidatus Taylorbacteria bacterium]|nr:ABC transporter permease [Candidatus Taylorbacteria bacterium]
MRWHRIQALLIRHLYLYKRSFPRIMDIVYWPVMELLVWGFLSMYIEKMNVGGFNAVTVLLGAVIFWDFLNQSQKSVSIAFLEDIWEKNLLNIFVTPLRLSEFFISTLLVGFVRLILVGIILTVLSFVIYGFNLFSLGFALIPFVLNLFLFGWALGLFANAIILRFGTSAQILAWGFLVLVQPFSAVFYPVSALPQLLQPLAYLLPSTYVFEGMRSVFATGTFSAPHLWGAILANAVYLTVMIWFFFKMFAYVKREGKLLKLN